MSGIQLWLDHGRKSKIVCSLVLRMLWNASQNDSTLPAIHTSGVDNNTALLLYNIISYMYFLCGSSFGSHVPPPKTHFLTTFLKLTMIASSPQIYLPLCECTPSVRTQLTYLFWYICSTMITYLLVCCLFQILNPKCQTYLCSCAIVCLFVS
jgi:hypothetical protein